MTPEQIRARNLWLRYGITVEEYDRILNFQSGVCAVCLKPPKPGARLAVDHQHQPPYWIRGLLCGSCNRYVIGRRTDPQLLFRAGAYLQNPPGKALMPEHSAPHKPRKRTNKRGKASD